MTPLSRLIGFAVETKSGQRLGTLADFEIDTGTFQVSSLIVKPAGIVRRMVEAPLVIAMSAVIDVTQRAIIVEDMAVKGGGKKVSAKEAVSPWPVPTMSAKG